MKALKAIGLAALVIVATTAVAGAGTAAATTLCQEDKNECPMGKRYPAKETILAGLEAKTTLNYEAVTGIFVMFKGYCEESSLTWSTTENRGPGKVLLGNVSSLLFGKCEKETNSCKTVTAQNLPYIAELLPSLVMGDGEIFLTNGGSGVRKLKFEKCGTKSVDCTYEGGAMTLFVEGGSPAGIVLFFESKAEGGNPLCGEKIKIKGTYEIAAPKPLWVEEKP